MDDKARIHHIIDDLNIPVDRFVLSGSGVMVMHGMDRKPRDLDLFCTTATWFGLMRKSGAHQWNVFVPNPDDRVTRCDPPYLYREMHGLEVNIFFGWRQRGVGDITPTFWIHNAELIEGVPCTPLQMIVAWKEQVARAKDCVDVETIRRFLGQVA